MSSHSPIKSLLVFPPCPPCICADSKHLPITVAIFRNYILFQHWNPKHPLFAQLHFLFLFLYRIYSTGSNQQRCSLHSMIPASVLYPVQQWNEFFLCIDLGKVYPQCRCIADESVRTHSWTCWQILWESYNWAAGNFSPSLACLHRFPYHISHGRS